jgi:hypothetical protein
MLEMTQRPAAPDRAQSCADTAYPLQPRQPERDVYACRREWLRHLAPLFPDQKAFAKAAGRNPKHLSAMKAGQKPMGSRVARDIEVRLAAVSGVSIWTGMLDTAPQNGDVSLSSQDHGPGRAHGCLHAQLLTAIEIVFEACPAARSTESARMQAKLVRLAHRMLLAETPRHQVAKWMREVALLVTSLPDGSTST